MFCAPVPFTRARRGANGRGKLIVSKRPALQNEYNLMTKKYIKFYHFSVYLSRDINHGHGNNSLFKVMHHKHDTKRKILT